MARVAQGTSNNGIPLTQDPTLGFKDSISDFKDALLAFLESVHTTVNGSSIKTESFDRDIAEISIEDGTVYIYTGEDGVSSLTIKYPESESFISTILFSTVSKQEGGLENAPIEVVFPEGTKFVGFNPPVFYPKEKWELNIMNKVVACSRIV